jgi:hypothetical protein
MNLPNININLPNINDPAWGWIDDNGLTAKGIEPFWEVTIRCGWIKINFYPTARTCTLGSIEFPAPDDKREAKLMAEDAAIWLQTELKCVGYLNQ